ncbi:MAG: glycosyltransferase family 8 protein [Butyrivibrio sp.]|nr:glycosyltransferase family 8 protein [Butyrivibrio sp.]
MNKIKGEEIHVALAVYDPEGTYSKFAGAAITSIFRNTDSRVKIHLLTDSYLSELNRERFCKVAKEYNQSIVFYDIDLGNQIPNVIGLKRVTRGTLYRLKLPEIIPSDINRIIYLDSDIIVNLDIKELWDEPFEGKSILAVKDPEAESVVSGKLQDLGILDANTYYNAGVMVWNLEKIRNTYDMFNEAMSFFENYGEYCKGFTDQHASNSIFKNDVRNISSDYNVFTKKIRKVGHTLKKAIYHFTDEIPKMELEESFDNLFYEIIEESPWGEKQDLLTFLSKGIKARNSVIELYRKIIRNTRNRAIVFWGCGSKYFDDVVGLFDIDCCRDYCVDSNPRFGGHEKHGMQIYSKTHIYEVEHEKIFVVVISKLYYGDIRDELVEQGMKENEDFIDGLMLLDDCKARKYVKS